MSEEQISDAWKRVGDGEFAGWTNWPSDNWEMHGGPFYYRREADGSARCAFRAEAKHMNGQGHMHGGCMMTFADFAMFGIGAEALGKDRAVTVSMSFEFVAGAQVGDLIEATGEVVKSGRRMIFIRGLITANGKPILNFSGSIMRITA